VLHVADGKLVCIWMLFSLQDFRDDHVFVNARLVDLFNFDACECQQVRQFFGR
jgi:hypothetical protein